ncbi:phosphodiesterase [Acutalibacter intestini]|uniref:phosphodiesterase n=1 Tax=Acutalibacter intestini TaxID=3093659 RepID=UPI002AC8B1C0|nr:phosphodiesterase [Acutalibacter sp. M00204]
MKWLIASDLHGSEPACQGVLSAFQREGAQRLLLLGDLLYHGPRNDLPAGYAPKEVARLLNAAAPRIFCVGGNCEAPVDQMVLDFPALAPYCLLETAGHMVFATHGHVYHQESPPALPPEGVLLHGHTHIPAKTRTPGGWWYLNPGSAALPKEGSWRGYMVLEDGLFLWKTLEGEEMDRLALDHLQ